VSESIQHTRSAASTRGDADGNANADANADAVLLAETERAVRAAGLVLLERFTAVSPSANCETVEGLVAAVHANDDAVLEILRPRLSELRPGAGWVEEELEGGALPAGEWWLVDPAEGNVNHVHGLPEWGLTATLVRENEPVFTVVHLPLTGETYTAIAGGGAFLDGRPLHVSEKTELRLGIAATSQARPGLDEATLRRVGSSITRMLLETLVVRVSVAATLHLLNVAAGRMDVFWQYSGTRADLLPGALLVAEAGGRFTDAAGHLWTPESESFLAAAPGLHEQAVSALSR
jgi:myo-inositol-1(or 4)-monophosphatase